MFTLSFGYSRSKYYSRAIEIAHDLGGKMENGIMSIELQDYQLLYSYEEVFPLLEIISKWKSLTGDYNGKKVDVFNFLFNIWRNVAGCAQGRNDSWDTRHCWSNIDNEGWGCKLINSISAHNYGDGRYIRSNRFWYNFGEFESDNVWKINKHLIFEKLQKEIESKNLFLCPFFNIDNVKRKVENLPDNIKPDELTFTTYYNEKGEKVNIRHVKMEDIKILTLKYSFN